MDNNYNTYNETTNTGSEKKVHVPSMVLMIIGAVFALILPIITYPCSIISLVMSITHRKTHKTTYAIVINIIALLLALANSVLGVMIQMGYITLPQ
ncbi:MAG: hypothetical protein K2J76_02965 [Oscillospiraceae bacterium]|nr:hypothetical protein [Oscillospiraceae bacterium]